MTEETGLKIVNILRASYPDDSYKLKEEKGDNFYIMLIEIFDRVPDDVMMQAIKATIKACTNLPSVADISKYVTQCRPTPKYPELPMHREKIDMSIINEAFRLAVDHKMTLKITPRLRSFSKMYFADITDDLIRKNYPELSINMKNNMTVDGHRAKMYMDKDGYIYTNVCI